MKKLICLLLLSLTVLGLFACGEGEETNQQDSKPQDDGTRTSFAEGDYVMLASATEAEKELSYKIKDALDPLLGEEGIAYIGSQYSTAAEHEILIGIYDEERVATVEARRIVEAMSGGTRYDMDYAVYAHGGCIAIYYETCDIATVSAAEVPVERIIGEILSQGLPDLPSGEVMRGRVDLYSLQVRADEEMLLERWSALTEELGEERVSALKLLYSLYSDKIPDWSASLYAKGYYNAECGMYLGGFYESTSGRDNLGFGPDVEATMQTLRFIEQSGMIDHLGDISLALPEWMQHQMVYFAKSLQAKNGYFYHPQWSVDATNKNLGRRGRDLGWAVGIMQTFGAEPTYNTPSGVRGDKISADDYLRSVGIEPPASPFESGALTARLGEGCAVMVSRVVTVSSDNTDFLSDFELFIDYIESKDIDTEPYHSTFNSTASQIKAASAKMGKYTPASDVTEEKYLKYSGLDMCGILMKYLNDHINPKTGLWGNDWEKYNEALDLAEDTTTPRMTGTEFKYTNGLHGHIAIYNSWGVAYPEPALAARSVLRGLLSDEPSESNICSLYNLWFCISSLRKNVELRHPASTRDEVLGIIDDALGRDGAAALINTYHKLAKYQKPDGGFAHNIYTGTPRNQGMPTGLGLNESNLDAVCIGTTGMVRTVFDSFDTESIPIYTASDFMRYMAIIEDSKPVMKAPYSVSTIDFEDGVIPPVISSEGELSVMDGALWISGGANIAVSPLSDIGSAIIFRADIEALEGDHRFTLMGDGELLYFTLRLADGKLRIVSEDGATISEAEYGYGGTRTLLIEIEEVSGGILAYASIGATEWEISSERAASIEAIKGINIDSAGGVLKIHELCFARAELSEHRFDSFPEVAIKHVSGDDVKENTLTVEELSGDGVLHFHREINYDGSQNYFDLTASELSREPSLAVFETRMLIAEGGSYSPIDFCLMPAGAAKSDRVFRMTFYAANMSYGTSISVYDSPNGTPSSSKKQATDAVIGEWFDLKIEYYEPSGGEECVIRVHINGKCVLETSEVYGLAQPVDVTDTVRFAPHTPFIGDVYFDDMSYVLKSN